MLKWAKDNLYIRSSDEWSYDTLEADPLVHLLVGACASEAKEVYENIQDSDDRLMQRLLRYILPESFHLPNPSVGIAKAQARISTCFVPNTQSLVFRDSEKSFDFTPLFDTNLVNAKVRFIGTDNQVVEQGGPPQYLLKNSTEKVSRLLIGIESPEKLASLEKVAFYVNWTGDTLEKRQFLLALSRSQWTWNGQAIKRQNGFLNAEEVHWQNHFDPEKQLAQRINAQYKSNFHLVLDSEEVPPINMSTKDVLTAWLNTNPLVSAAVKKTTANWTQVKGNFIWLRIDLPYSVSLTDIEQHLTFSLNHFIVVNRSLEEKDDSDTYFSRSLGLEALEIVPKKGLFHSIRTVENQLQNEPIPSLSMAALLKENRETAYSFRLGGVGRYDNYNAWQRISYILSIFRQEHNQHSLAQRLGDKMSLEELEEAIGQQLFKQQAKQKKDDQTPPVYLFVQVGKHRDQFRVKIQYWVTDGDAANELRPGSQLLVEPALAGIESTSVQLVSSTNGGKNRYSPTEQIQALQDTLYRRGRIVSAHDVKSLCHQKLGKSLKKVDVRSYFETDRNSIDGGVRRAIEVILRVDKAEDPYIQQLGQEIELILQENSVGTMPYRVVIAGE